MSVSSYNHPAQGDYNTDALIFKLATVTRFLDVFEEETNKMKENAILSDNHLRNYTKTIIILLRLSEYCQIIPQLCLGIIWRHSLCLRRIIIIVKLKVLLVKMLKNNNLQLSMKLILVL